MMKFQQIVPSQNTTNHPKSFTLIHLFWSTKMKFVVEIITSDDTWTFFLQLVREKKLLATFGNFTPFWQLVAIFGNMWLFLRIFGNFCQFLATSGNFWQQ